MWGSFAAHTESRLRARRPSYSVTLCICLEGYVPGNIVYSLCQAMMIVCLDVSARFGWL